MIFATRKSYVLGRRSLFHGGTRMTQCIFCHSEISDMGLGWYDHVHQSHTCNALWGDWIEKVAEDHPEG